MPSGISHHTSKTKKKVQADRRCWAAVDTSVLEDRRLSFRDKGVLAFLLSRPDGWDLSGLLAVSTDGRDGVRKSLQRLEEYGYLRTYADEMYLR